MPTISDRVAALREYYSEGHTRSLAWRREQLLGLRQMFVEREAEFSQALYDDLRKPKTEAFISEIGFCIAEIDHTLRHLASWVKPRKVSAPVFIQPGSAWVQWEPLGLALIIGAWNYPVQLTLGPLIPCIAAGNVALIKPSQTSISVFRTIGKYLPEYLDTEAFYVTAEEERDYDTVLAERYDKIFFTGGTVAARDVMAAAAGHLTPVTLELGGKSPCFVDKAANLAVAARRIVSGRFMNAGQTCVAPDYVLAHKDIREPLLEKLASAVRDFYGDHPQESADYARIINDRHFGRLTGLLTGENAVIGGQSDPADRYIAPTILRDVSPDAPVMREEIFGPILPVLEVADVDEAIQFINDREKPLALYVFTQDKAVAHQVFAQTSSGAACHNQAVLHCAVHDLPFGGVGMSGMGKYHGRWGFETFSNAKAALRQSTSIDPSLSYPPFTPKKSAILRAVLSAKNTVDAITKAIAAAIRGKG